MTGPSFFAAEITAVKPGAGTFTYAQGHGSHPRGTLAQFADAVQSTSVITASDIGYRTAPTDAGGVTAYPPLVVDAFQVDRRLNLDPMQSSVAAAWGTLSLSNADRRFDSVAATWNSDNRPVKILSGVKGYDATRGLYTDPAYTTLTPAFIGVAEPWFLSDTELQIPLRDASYFAEISLQQSIYGGTGTYDGTAALAGKPRPKARGGTTAAPIRNVTPVLVDPVAQIYQYNDGPGTVVNAYEGAAVVWTYAGDTTNLYSGSPAAGTYRTDNSRGLFQLGSTPQRSVTVDITGQFPGAGAITTVAQIARYLLTEDLAVPIANVDTASFVVPVASSTGLPGRGTRPHGTLQLFVSTDPADPAAGTAGIYWGPDNMPDGPTALSQLLSAVGGQIVPTRTGLLSLLLLRAIPDSATPDATWDTSKIVSLTPQTLPASVSPPLYRSRIGYAANYTIMSSGVSPSATATQQQFVAASGPSAVFLSSTVQQQWLRPNDIGPLAGPLLQLSDAQQAANLLGALWGVRRRLYSAVVPASVALSLDIGNVVQITWPADDLRGGKLGQIVGESWTSSDATITLSVLV